MTTPGDELLQKSVRKSNKNSGSPPKGRNAFNPYATLQYEPTQDAMVDNSKPNEDLPKKKRLRPKSRGGKDPSTFSQFYLDDRAKEAASIVDLKDFRASKKY